MKVLKFIYNEKTVEFSTEGKTNVMVNATEMGRIFGKKPYDFYVNDSVQKFIEAFCQTDIRRFGEESQNGNSRFGESSGNGNYRFQDEFTQDGKLIKIVKGNTEQGTWMHEVVALKFAAWLDPYFEVWVYQTIHKLINQEVKAIREAMLERVTAAQRKEAKKKELVSKYPELIEYFDLEKQEKTERNKQVAVIKQQYKQLCLEF